MTETDFIFLLSVFVMIEFFVGWYFERGRAMTCAENTKTLLESGVSLEKKRIYLYKHGLGYKVLDLNQPDGQNDEFLFSADNYSEALEKFLELTNVS